MPPACHCVYGEYADMWAVAGHHWLTLAQFRDDARLLLRAGVIQMNAGIVNSLFNQLYFRDSLSTWCAMRRRGYMGSSLVSCFTIASMLSGQTPKRPFHSLLCLSQMSRLTNVSPVC